jgi:hypothetical protein
MSKCPTLKKREASKTRHAAYKRSRDGTTPAVTSSTVYHRPVELKCFHSVKGLLFVCVEAMRSTANVGYPSRDHDKVTITVVVGSLLLLLLLGSIEKDV